MDESELKEQLSKEVVEDYIRHHRATPSVGEDGWEYLGDAEDPGDPFTMDYVDDEGRRPTKTVAPDWWAETSYKRREIIVLQIEQIALVEIFEMRIKRLMSSISNLRGIGNE